MGFDSSIIYDNATSMLEAKKVETILSWAQEAGKDTGKYLAVSLVWSYFGKSEYICWFEYQNI